MDDIADLFVPEDDVGPDRISHESQRQSHVEVSVPGTDEVVVQVEMSVIVVIAGTNRADAGKKPAQIVDEDEDGFDAYDEKLTGHSDNNPDDKPTQEEVDAALAELEKEEDN